MRAKQAQSGFALLFYLIVVIGFLIAGLSGLLGSSLKQKNEQDKIDNIRILKEAKEALLSYALNYAVLDDIDKMGKLPCPDADPSLPAILAENSREGVQDNVCGAKGVNTLGYFPFKTLGLGKIEDAYSECLWYVVSGDYKNYIDADMLNWDSLGYLEMRDESDNLKHGSDENDFPVAFIISPGKAINQNRNPDLALPGCNGNFTLSSYLEGGPNIDYAADLPATTDTLWKIVTTSPSAVLESVDYNDQVVAIYKNELWDRIKKLKDLSIDNTSPASSKIEFLTKSLAECLAAYGNANANRLLPYPAPLTLADYRDNTEYDDDNTIRYGRFPQILDNSVSNQANFVIDTAGTSYCEGVVATAYDELFWKNWKDHFFYIVSEDFDSASVVPADVSNTKCNGFKCITIDGKSNKLAAMIIFAGAASGQSRKWWWDEGTTSVTIDEKSNPVNYLEGVNQTVYATGTQNFVSTEPDDYAYCIEYNESSPYELISVKCADI